MHIWTIDNWEKIYSAINVKSGLRLHFDKAVDNEIKRACKQFANWLREEYFFPVRVNIYFKDQEYIRAIDGENVSATFWEPFDRDLTPYIKIAAGDYPKLLHKWGNDNAISSYLYSIAHELTHYFQWINDVKLTEIGMERQATTYAHYVVSEYTETTEHP